VGEGVSKFVESASIEAVDALKFKSNRYEIEVVLPSVGVLPFLAIVRAPTQTPLSELLCAKTSFCGVKM
jgi:predicted dinucleotide-utilizing enzyme